MNVEDLRYFLALARYGRLTVAAARLGVEHTTVRRRISALERQLKTRLFDKTSNGWTLSSTGQRLLPYAEQIEVAAEKAQEAVTDRKRDLRGTLRILTTDGYGTRIIAPGLMQLHKQHPHIEIEMVTMSQLLNYGFGEFDIAITIHDPEHPGFHSIPLCDYELRLYAASQYLNTCEPIHELADLSEHEMIWFVESLLELPEVRTEYSLPQTANIHFRTTNVFAQLEATAAGLGIGLLPCFLAHYDPRLVPVLHEQYRVPGSYRIIVPSRMLDTELVSTVTTFIMQETKRRADLFIPPLPE